MTSASAISSNPDANAIDATVAQQQSVDLTAVMKMLDVVANAGSRQTADLSEISHRNLHLSGRHESLVGKYAKHPFAEAWHLYIHGAIDEVMTHRCLSGRTAESRLGIA
jgi:hypothetical protein